MAVAYFQIQLSVQPKSGGGAVLVPPTVLQSTNYAFVIVKEGGAEAIVRIEGTDAVLRQVEKDKNCKKLTAKQLAALQESYPKPKIKSKYRTQEQPQATGAAPLALFEVDETGNKVVDTFQTVRSGFYLIDVPILPESSEKS